MPKKSKTTKTPKKYDYPEAPKFDGHAEFKLNPESKKNERHVSGIVLIVALVVAIFGLLVITQMNINQSDNIATSSFVEAISISANEVEGEVEVSTDNGNSFLPLNQGDSISSGSLVRSGDRAFASIQFEGGSLARLDENTAITIRTATKERIGIVNEQGRVFSRVVNAQDSIYEVYVGEESFVAEGTAFMTLNETTSKGVMVFHGSLTPKSNESISITEGQFFKSYVDGASEITTIVVGEIKTDQFVLKNIDKDKTSSVFVTELGLLEEL